MLKFKSLFSHYKHTHSLSPSHAHVQTVAQTTQSNTTSVSTTGFGGAGDRQFPPSNGMTYSTWFLMCNIQPGEHQPINLLTLSQCFLTTEKTLASYPLLRIYLLPAENSLYVSTQMPREKRDSIVEDYIHKDDRLVQVNTLYCMCSFLCVVM